MNGMDEIELRFREWMKLKHEWVMTSVCVLTHFLFLEFWHWTPNKQRVDKWIKAMCQHLILPLFHMWCHCFIYLFIYFIGHFFLSLTFSVYGPTILIFFSTELMENTVECWVEFWFTFFFIFLWYFFDTTWIENFNELVYNLSLILFHFF